jgi:hypothetical protein
MFTHKEVSKSQSWNITPFRLSETDYSIYSLLLSIYRGLVIHLQIEDAPL